MLFQFLKQNLCKKLIKLKKTSAIKIKKQNYNIKIFENAANYFLNK